MTATISEDTLARVKDALYRGKKIEAIKWYREETHASLAESKHAVERYEAELWAAAPEKFVAGPKSGKNLLFNLTLYCIMAGWFAIICVRSAVRQATGEEKASLRTWIAWFVLAAALFAANEVFRKLRKLRKP